MKAISNQNQHRPELLAPAGDFEKMQFAFAYGADAVYLGGGDFSLRANAGFSLAEIGRAVEYAHAIGKKVYVAINIYANQADIRSFPDFLREMAALSPDALIVSDPGIFSLCRKLAPEIQLHISTQSSTTNAVAAQFWAEQGASRVVLARELSIAEAAEVAANGGLETEMFVHGAMCVSYSGRCLLSHFMTGRSGNRGECTHPCRWNYALQEEKRPGEYFPIEEDARGAYIMNSKDLCLLDFVPELMQSGVSSWKIEGRNKSAYYVANTVRIYRAAIDAYLAEGDAYVCRPEWREELQKVSHRGYTSAFAMGFPGGEAFRYDDGGYLRTHDFAAIAHGVKDGLLCLEERNHFAVGETLDLLLPNGETLCLPISSLQDADGVPRSAARHPKERVYLPYHGDENLPWPLICRKAVG